MPRDSTITLTDQYVRGKFRHRFWTNIMQVVTGGPYWNIDRDEFWSSVSFYNYVQMPVAEGPGVAPTPEMFGLSELAFFKYSSKYPRPSFSFSQNACGLTYRGESGDRGQ